MGWALILAEEAGSQEGGLELFPRELEEFEALRIARVEELVLGPEAKRYNREEASVPRTARNFGPWVPRFSDAEEVYKVKLSDGRELLAVETEAGRARVEVDSLVWWPEGGIDAALEKCFGPLTWAESGVDFLHDKLLVMF